MRYWENTRRERTRAGIVTLNMIAESLECVGYEVVHMPTVNASFGVIATQSNTRALDDNPDGNANILFLASIDGASSTILDVDERANSYLIRLESGAQLPENPTSREQRILARAVVVRPGPDASNANQLENDITNFVISIERFATFLAQSVNSTNPYQALVDVAEDFFGNFISIVDPNNMLLAYTKHIEPIDDISADINTLLFRGVNGFLNLTRDAEAVAL